MYGCIVAEWQDFIERPGFTVYLLAHTPFERRPSPTTDGESIRGS